MEFVICLTSSKSDYQTYIYIYGLDCTGEDICVSSFIFGDVLLEAIIEAISLAYAELLLFLIILGALRYYIDST